MIQAITLSLATLGAILGIINTWHNLDKSRVKIKVLPQHAIPVGTFNPKLTFCIAITNLSTFPVTIRNAGVEYQKTDIRSVLIKPEMIDNGKWPRRLEPRSSFTVYMERPERIIGHPIKCAFAETDCGSTFTGNSPALKQIISEIG